MNANLPANYADNSQTQIYSDLNENYPQIVYPQYNPNPIFPPQVAYAYDPTTIPQPTMYYQYQPTNGKPIPNQLPTQSYTPNPPSISPSSPPNTSPIKGQLYFSKHPREVYFKPHNLNDYRKLKEELSSLKMGNLGPDLQVSIS